MLPEQILAVVISVRRAHDGVDVIPRGPVGGMECRRPHRTLVIELDQDHRAVDTVVEHAIVSRRADPGETCVIEVRYRLAMSDAIMKTDQSLREINNDIFSYDEGWYLFTMVVLTPTFMGAEPARAMSGTYQGNDDLQQEQDLISSTALC